MAGHQLGAGDLFRLNDSTASADSPARAPGARQSVALMGARQVGTTTLVCLRLDEIDREALWLNGDEPDVRALLSDPSSRSGGDQLGLFLFFWSRVKHRVQQRAGRFLRALQLRFDDGQRHVGLAEEHVVRTLRLRARMRRPSLADAPFRKGGFRFLPLLQAAPGWRATTLPRCSPEAARACAAPMSSKVKRRSSRRGRSAPSPASRAASRRISP